MPARKFRFHHLLLLFILLIGSILRFWNYGQLPYTHDEFSALNRLDYGSFSELVDNGIKPDGHPAGVQVFLYYWVKLVGNGEVWVKLPFVICGILSIGLLYLIGVRWFSATVGLAAAAFLASLQYPVMYSQIARPYVSGLFFSLLMVWGWTLFLFSKQKKTGWVVFVLGAVLCCYNHYFSHLLAIIVGLSGLFFISRKEDMRAYIAGGVIILLLYLPHIPIFLHQLSIGGVSWLAPPTPAFFPRYLAYIFHFSIPLFLLVLVLVGGSWFFRKKQTSRMVQLRFLSLCWFLLPMLIGYFYSVWAKPLLQYSVLIFSFPFLLLFLFSFLPPLRPAWKAALVFAILTACSLTLIFHRHHYRYFYHQTFKAVAEETVAAEDSLGAENLGVLLSANPTHVQFYFDKMHRQPNVVRYLSSALQVPLLQQILDSMRTPYLALGVMSAIPGEYISLIRQQYAYMIKRQTGPGFEFYLFSKTKPDVPDAQPPRWNWRNDFESPNGLLLDSNYLAPEKGYRGSTGYLIDSTIEYGPTARFTRKELPARDGDLLIVSVKILVPDTPVNALLALNISEDDKSIYWADRLLMQYIRKPGQWQTVYLAINPAHALWGNGKTMSIFVWNRNRDTFYIDDFQVEVVEENRNRNVLMEDVQ